MEGNEWAFCYLWAEESASFDGCAKVLVNSKLQNDYFFNRAKAAGCQNLGRTIERVAKVFWRNRLDCYLYDIDGSLPRGMKQVDTMSVLKASGCEGANKKVTIIDRQLLPVWIDIFCKSFRVPEWRAEVERIFDANFHKLELLLSYRDGSPAGCAALFTHNDVTGLYCLGTVSSQRRRGLAAEILKAASAMKRNLFLQTLESEGLVNLYEKAGFEVAYTKKIFVIPKPARK